MNAAPLVDVVMPVHNGAPELARAIESVEDQTYDEWRLTVVDNCSTDDTANIVEAARSRDDRIRLRRYDDFVPAIENFNRSMRVVGSDAAFCKPLHADDWLEPRCLEQMTAIGVRHPTCAVIGAQAVSDGLPLFVHYPGDEVMAGRDVVRGYLRWVAAAEGGFWVFGSPSNTMLRADVVREDDAFYDTADIHADSDVCCRLLLVHDFAFVDETLTGTGTPDTRISARALQLKTQVASEALHLERYGEAVFDDVELRRLRHMVVERYDVHLAEAVVQRKGRRFWQLHSRARRAIGAPIRPVRIARRVPGVGWRKLVGRVRRRLGRSAPSEIAR